MRAACHSWPEIVGFADDAGLTTSFGRSRWHHRALWALMKNRAYVGEARSGEFVLHEAHPPIVERGIWEASQSARTLTVSRGRHPTLLAGLLRCGSCRHLMSPGGLPARGGTTNRYFCKGDALGGCRERPAVRASVVEKLVEEQFFVLYEDSPIRRSARPEARRRAERELVDAERALSRLRGEAASADKPDPGEISEATALADRLRQRTITLARSTLLVSPALLRSRWPQMSVGERRRHISHVVDWVYLRGGPDMPLPDRILIPAYGEGRAELPRRGVRMALGPIEWPSLPAARSGAHRGRAGRVQGTGCR